MPRNRDETLLELLREIRDGQRDIAERLDAWAVRADEHACAVRAAVEAAAADQHAAARRQRAAVWLGGAAILACLAAVLYLVARYL